MALRYIDSMGDHYDDSSVTLKWTEIRNAARVPGLHGYARKGEHRKGLAFGSNTVTMEAYIYADTRVLGTVFALYDTLHSSLLKQVLCSVTDNGSITVGRGAGEVVFALTASDLVRANTWYHFGWRVLVHPTAGTVELRIDGGTVLSVTGVDTTATTGDGPSYWSGALGSFAVGGAFPYDNLRIDDLVVMDDVPDGINDLRLPGGGGYTKFIGPVEVKVKRPSGPGLVADWTPSPAGPNYQNVDDSTPDGDATINTAAPSAIGASDLFAMEDLLPGEDVLAVQSLVLARKTEEGTAALATLSHDGVTTRVGTTIYQPSTYSYMHAPEPLAPDGSLWTAAKWNAVQYGYRRIL